MASTRRKSAAIALAVVGVAGLSLAAAAQLDLNSETLGAGSTVVASCDDDVADDGIGVTFTRGWAATEDVTSAVNFATVGSTCAGLDYELTVLGADGSDTDSDPDVLQTVSDEVPTLASGAFSVTISQATEDIEGIALVIHG